MKPAEGSTVIGKSVVIRGELSGSEDLYIDGDVEGTVTLPESRLTIGPNAAVKANLQVHDVIILGSCEGNTTATGRVETRPASSSRRPWGESSARIPLRVIRARSARSRCPVMPLVWAQ